MTSTRTRLRLLPLTALPSTSGQGPERRGHRRAGEAASSGRFAQGAPCVLKGSPSAGRVDEDRPRPVPLPMLVLATAADTRTPEEDRRASDTHLCFHFNDPFLCQGAGLHHRKSFGLQIRKYFLGIQRKMTRVISRSLRTNLTASSIGIAVYFLTLSKDDFQKVFLFSPITFCGC